MSEEINSLLKSKKIFEKVDEIKCELIAEKMMGFQPVPKDEINKFLINKWLANQTGGETGEFKKIWKRKGDSILQNFLFKVPNYYYDYKENQKLLNKLGINYSICMYNIDSQWVVSIYTKDKKKCLSSCSYRPLQSAIVNSIFSLLSETPQVNTSRMNTKIGNIIKTTLLKIFQHFDKPEDNLGKFIKEKQMSNKEIMFKEITVQDKMNKIKCEFIAEKMMGYKPISKEEFFKQVISKEGLEFLFPGKLKKIEAEDKQWINTRTSSIKLPDYICDYKDNAELLEKINRDYSVCIYNLCAYWVASIYSRDKKKHLSSSWNISLQSAIVNSIFSLLSETPQVNTSRMNTKIGNIIKTTLLKIFQHFDKPEDNYEGYKEYYKEVYIEARKEINKEMAQ